MSAKHIARYRLDITIEGEMPYDPAIPTSYTEALAKIDEKRQSAIGLGGKVTRDDVRPVKVKE